jgi:hypothetical protein
MDRPVLAVARRWLTNNALFAHRAFLSSTYSQFCGNGCFQFLASTAGAICRSGLLRCALVCEVRSRRICDRPRIAFTAVRSEASIAYLEHQIYLDCIAKGLAEPLPELSVHSSIHLFAECARKHAQRTIPYKPARIAGLSHEICLHSTYTLYVSHAW